MAATSKSFFYDASVHARIALEVAAQHGLSPDGLLAASGLDPAAVAVPYGRIPAAGLIKLLGDIVAASGDELLGLHMGEHIPMQRIGIVGQNIRALPRVRDGMQEAFAALRGVSNAVALVGWFDEAPARVETRIALDHPVYVRQMAEFHASAFASTCRRAPGRADFLMQEVAFAHSAPPDISPYLAFFGCPVRFSQPRHLLTFDAAWLDQDHASADRDLQQALAPYVREIMAALAPPLGWADRTRAESLQLLEQGKFNLESLSRRLGVKPRTLQHKLQGEGVTFSRLVDGVRKDLALRYLVTQNAPATEVAYLLGMEPGSFYRAFRRWTGTTPQAYRAQAAPATHPPGSTAAET